MTEKSEWFNPMYFHRVSTVFYHWTEVPYWQTHVFRNRFGVSRFPSALDDSGSSEPGSCTNCESTTVCTPSISKSVLVLACEHRGDVANAPCQTCVGHLSMRSQRMRRSSDAPDVWEAWILLVSVALGTQWVKWPTLRHNSSAVSPGKIISGPNFQVTGRHFRGVENLSVPYLHCSYTCIYIYICVYYIYIYNIYSTYIYTVYIYSTCTYIYSTYIYIHYHIHICTWCVWCVYIYIYIYTHTHVYTCLFMYVHICTYMNISIYTLLYMYIYIYI